MVSGDRLALLNWVMVKLQYKKKLGIVYAVTEGKGDTLAQYCGISTYIHIHGCIPAKCRYHIQTVHDNGHEYCKGNTEISDEATQTIKYSIT